MYMTKTIKEHLEGIDDERASMKSWRRGFKEGEKDGRKR